MGESSISSALAAFVWLIMVLCCSSIRLSVAVDGNRRTSSGNSLGLTPPMGWNSWNHFACNIDETLIKETANALISSGLAQQGYNYVNIDDCWGATFRDSQGNLVPDPTRFPSGMAALADYVHGLGLKFGIYACAGARTCSGFMPGSLGYEQQDANTFASWGVDYLKYDNCNNNNISPLTRYKKMSDALKSSGRPIYYNICEWGDMLPALWGPSMGNSWRTTDDISDVWEMMLCIADMNAVYAEYAKPGAWNDPDMLEVGNGGMTYDQYKVHYSIWAISKAPLIIGCDVRNVTNETMSILANHEVIAVNQDPLGVQAKKLRNFGQREIWGGPLSGNRTALLFVNRKSMSKIITALWSDLGFGNNVVAQARDIWQHVTLNTTFQGNMTMTLDPFSCKMFVLTPMSTL